MTKTSAVPPTRGEELLQRLNIKWGRLKGRTSPDNLKRLGQSAHDSLHDGRLDRQLAKYEMWPHYITGGVVIVYLLLHLAAVSQGVGIASWYYHAAFWAAILAYASFQIGDYLVQQHSEEDLQLMVRRPAAERQIRKVQNPNPTPTTRTQGEDETTEQWMERMTKQHEEKKRK